MSKTINQIYPGRKVTMELIESRIERFAFKYYETLTICIAKHKNGFTATGQSACADPANYDKALGEDLAKKDALNKFWALEGFLLKEMISQENPPAGKLTDDAKWTIDQVMVAFGHIVPSIRHATCEDQAGAKSFGGPQSTYTTSDGNLRSYETLYAHQGVKLEGEELEPVPDGLSLAVLKISMITELVKWIEGRQKTILEEGGCPGRLIWRKYPELVEVDNKLTIRCRIGMDEDLPF